MPTLELHPELSKLQSLYNDNPKNQKFSALIVGEGGSGKTYSLGTAPGPVLVHMFDPRGEITLAGPIKEGRVVVDNRFSNEDRLKPSAFDAWIVEMQRLEREKVFDSIGTYALDSLTTFGDAILNKYLRGRTRQSLVKDQVYEMWDNFLMTMKDMVRRITMLPCNTILTGHLLVEKDETTGVVRSIVALSGKSATHIPLMFSEYYVATVDAAKKYSFLTNSDGYYRAKSRLAASGKLDLKEEPNFKAILAKTGFDSSDK